jgi:hypothetical protein
VKGTSSCSLSVSRGILSSNHVRERERAGAGVGERERREGQKHESVLVMSLLRCDNLTGSRRLSVNYPTESEISTVIALKPRAVSPCHRHDISMP